MTMMRVPADAAFRPLPTCPTCGRVAREEETPTGPRSFCCDVYSFWRAPLVDRATHEARRDLHFAFDALWKGNPDEQARQRIRWVAFRLLEQLLGVGEDQAHIGQLSYAQCLTALEGIPVLREGLILHPALPAVMTEHLWRTPKEDPE